MSWEYYDQISEAEYEKDRDDEYINEGQSLNHQRRTRPFKFITGFPQRATNRGQSFYRGYWRGRNLRGGKTYRGRGGFRGRMKPVRVQRSRHVSGISDEQENKSPDLDKSQSRERSYPRSNKSEKSCSPGRSSNKACRDYSRDRSSHRRRSRSRSRHRYRSRSRSRSTRRHSHNRHRGRSRSNEGKHNRRNYDQCYKGDKRYSRNEREYWPTQLRTDGQVKRHDQCLNDTDSKYWSNLSNNDEENRFNESSSGYETFENRKPQIKKEKNENEQLEKSSREIQHSASRYQNHRNQFKRYNETNMRSKIKKENYKLTYEDIECLHTRNDRYHYYRDPNKSTDSNEYSVFDTSYKELKEKSSQQVVNIAKSISEVCKIQITVDGKRSVMKDWSKVYQRMDGNKKPKLENDSIFKIETSEQSSEMIVPQSTLSESMEKLVSYSNQENPHAGNLANKNIYHEGGEIFTCQSKRDKFISDQRSNTSAFSVDQKTDHSNGTPQNGTFNSKVSSCETVAEQTEHVPYFTNISKSKKLVKKLHSRKPLLPTPHVNKCSQDYQYKTLHTPYNNDNLQLPDNLPNKEKLDSAINWFLEKNSVEQNLLNKSLENDYEKQDNVLNITDAKLSGGMDNINTMNSTSQNKDSCYDPQEYSNSGNNARSPSDVKQQSLNNISNSYNTEKTKREKQLVKSASFEHFHETDSHKHDNKRKRHSSGRDVAGQGDSNNNKPVKVLDHSQKSKTFDRNKLSAEVDKTSGLNLDTIVPCKPTVSENKEQLSKTDNNIDSKCTPIKVKSNSQSAVKSRTLSLDSSRHFKDLSTENLNMSDNKLTSTPVSRKTVSCDKDLFLSPVQSMTSKIGKTKHSSHGNNTVKCTVSSETISDCSSEGFIMLDSWQDGSSVEKSKSDLNFNEPKTDSEMKSSKLLKEDEKELVEIEKQMESGGNIFEKIGNKKTKQRCRSPLRVSAIKKISSHLKTRKPKMQSQQKNEVQMNKKISKKDLDNVHILKKTKTVNLLAISKDSQKKPVNHDHLKNNLESHDKSMKSHDTSKLTSHDRTKEMQNKLKKPCDKLIESDEKMKDLKNKLQRPCDKLVEKHNKTNESQNKLRASHDISKASHSELKESHETCNDTMKSPVHSLFGRKIRTGLEDFPLVTNTTTKKEKGNVIESKPSITVPSDIAEKLKNKLPKDKPSITIPSDIAEKLKDKLPKDKPSITVPSDIAQKLKNKLPKDKLSITVPSDIAQKLKDKLPKDNIIKRLDTTKPSKTINKEKKKSDEESNEKIDDVYIKVHEIKSHKENDKRKVIDEQKEGKTEYNINESQKHSKKEKIFGGKNMEQEKNDSIQSVKLKNKKHAKEKLSVTKERENQDKQNNKEEKLTDNTYKEDEKQVTRNTQSDSKVHTAKADNNKTKHKVNSRKDKNEKNKVVKEQALTNCQNDQIRTEKSVTSQTIGKESHVTNTKENNEKHRKVQEVNNHQQQELLKENTEKKREVQKGNIEKQQENQKGSNEKQRENRKDDSEKNRDNRKDDNEKNREILQKEDDDKEKEVGKLCEGTFNTETIVGFEESEESFECVGIIENVDLNTVSLSADELEKLENVEKVAVSSDINSELDHSFDTSADEIDENDLLDLNGPEISGEVEIQTSSDEYQLCPENVFGGGNVFPEMIEEVEVSTNDEMESVINENPGPLMLHVSHVEQSKSLSGNDKTNSIVNSEYDGRSSDYIENVTTKSTDMERQGYITKDDFSNGTKSDKVLEYHNNIKCSVTEKQSSMHILVSNKQSAMSDQRLDKPEKHSLLSDKQSNLDKHCKDKNKPDKPLLEKQSHMVDTQSRSPSVSHKYGKEDKNKSNKQNSAKPKKSAKDAVITTECSDKRENNQKDCSDDSLTRSQDKSKYRTEQNTGTSKQYLSKEQNVEQSATMTKQQPSTVTSLSKEHHTKTPNKQLPLDKPKSLLEKNTPNKPLSKTTPSKTILVNDRHALKVPGFVKDVSNVVQKGDNSLKSDVKSAKASIFKNWESSSKSIPPKSKVTDKRKSVDSKECSVNEVSRKRPKSIGDLSAVKKSSSEPNIRDTKSKSIEDKNSKILSDDLSAESLMEKLHKDKMELVARKSSELSETNGKEEKMLHEQENNRNQAKETLENNQQIPVTSESKSIKESSLEYTEGSVSELKIVSVCGGVDFDKTPERNKTASHKLHIDIPNVDPIANENRPVTPSLENFNNIFNSTPMKRYNKKNEKEISDGADKNDKSQVEVITMPSLVHRNRRTESLNMPLVLREANNSSGESELDSSVDKLVIDMDVESDKTVCSQSESESVETKQQTTNCMDTKHIENKDADRTSNLKKNLKSQNHTEQEEQNNVLKGNNSTKSSDPDETLIYAQNTSETETSKDTLESSQIQLNQNTKNKELEEYEDVDDEEDMQFMWYIKGVPQSPWMQEVKQEVIEDEDEDDEEFRRPPVLPELEDYFRQNPEIFSQTKLNNDTSDNNCIIPSSQPDSPQLEDTYDHLFFNNIPEFKYEATPITEDEEKTDQGENESRNEEETTNNIVKKEKNNTSKTTLHENNGGNMETDSHHDSEAETYVKDQEDKTNKIDPLKFDLESEKFKDFRKKMKRVVSVTVNDKDEIVSCTENINQSDSEENNVDPKVINDESSTENRTKYDSCNLETDQSQADGSHKVKPTTYNNEQEKELSGDIVLDSADINRNESQHVSTGHDDRPSELDTQCPSTSMEHKSPTGTTADENELEKQIPSENMYDAVKHHYRQRGTVITEPKEQQKTAETTMMGSLLFPPAMQSQNKQLMNDLDVLHQHPGLREPTKKLLITLGMFSMRLTNNGSYDFSRYESIKFSHTKILTDGVNHNTVGEFIPKFLSDRLLRCVKCDRCRQDFSPYRFMKHVCNVQWMRVSDKSFQNHPNPTQRLVGSSVVLWKLMLYVLQIEKHLRAHYCGEGKAPEIPTTINTGSHNWKVTSSETIQTQDWQILTPLTQPSQTHQTQGSQLQAHQTLSSQLQAQQTQAYSLYNQVGTQNTDQHIQSSGSSTQMTVPQNPMSQISMHPPPAHLTQRSNMGASLPYQNSIPIQQASIAHQSGVLPVVRPSAQSIYPPQNAHQNNVYSLPTCTYKQPVNTNFGQNIRNTNQIVQQNITSVNHGQSNITGLNHRQPNITNLNHGQLNIQSVNHGQMYSSQNPGGNLIYSYQQQFQPSARSSISSQGFQVSKPTQQPVVNNPSIYHYNTQTQQTVPLSCYNRQPVSSSEQNYTRVPNVCNETAQQAGNLRPEQGYSLQKSTYPRSEQGYSSHQSGNPRPEKGYNSHQLSIPRSEQGCSSTNNQQRNSQALEDQRTSPIVSEQNSISGERTTILQSPADNNVLLNIETMGSPQNKEINCVSQNTADNSCSGSDDNVPSKVTPNTKSARNTPENKDESTAISSSSFDRFSGEKLHNNSANKRKLSGSCDKVVRRCLGCESPLQEVNLNTGSSANQEAATQSSSRVKPSSSAESTGLYKQLNFGGPADVIKAFKFSQDVQLQAMSAFHDMMVKDREKHENLEKAFEEEQTRRVNAEKKLEEAEEKLKKLESQFGQMLEVLNKQS